jgi:Ca2+-binding RTX toxin-like protein
VWNNGKWRNGGGGRDTIDLRFQAPWDVHDNANGRGGDDIIYGNIADNFLEGGGGNDYIEGSWGNDRIDGGDSGDELWGQEGDDDLDGQGGADYLNGGWGDDNLSGGTNNDVLDGDDGDDILHGNTGRDRLIGGPGNDRLYAADEDDLDPDQDKLDGDSGDDFLVGSHGDNEMSGGSGNDELRDQRDSHIAADRDLMFGGDGNDVILSRGGPDLISGGDGSDRIVILNTHSRLSLVDIDGGSGIDTLVFDVPDDQSFALIWPSDITGIEHIDMEDSANGLLTLTFRNVINTSDSSRLTIHGDGLDGDDTIQLQNNVPGDIFDGGSWVRGVTQLGLHGESFVQYHYVLRGGIYATASIDSDIDVFLI